jgi:hypothetical protein
MQSVVMNENANRALHREQTRHVFHSLAQFIQSRWIRAIASPQTITAGRSLVRIRRWRGCVELTALQVLHKLLSFQISTAR